MNVLELERVTWPTKKLSSHKLFSILGRNCKPALTFRGIKTDTLTNGSRENPARLQEKILTKMPRIYNIGKRTVSPLNGVGKGDVYMQANVIGLLSPII